MKPKATEKNWNRNTASLNGLSRTWRFLRKNYIRGKRFRRQPLVSIARGTVLVADLQQTSQAYLQAPDTDKEALIATLHRLVELYPAHISKEDYLLFSMTDKILSDTNKRPYPGVQTTRVSIGLDVHHGFEQVAEKIVAKDSRGREYSDRSASCIDSYWRGQFEPVARAIK
jgi:hypothetical protein